MQSRGGSGRQDVYQSRDRRCERVFSGGDACLARTGLATMPTKTWKPNALPPARLERMPSCLARPRVPQVTTPSPAYGCSSRDASLAQAIGNPSRAGCYLIRRGNRRIAWSRCCGPADATDAGGVGSWQARGFLCRRPAAGAGVGDIVTCGGCAGCWQQWPVVTGHPAKLRLAPLYLSTPLPSRRLNPLQP